MPSEDTDTKRNRELFGMAGIAKKIKGVMQSGEMEQIER